MAVVETQKGAIEIFEADVLDRILVQPGEQVPGGRALATPRTDGAAPKPESGPRPLERLPSRAPPALLPETPPPEMPPVRAAREIELPPEPPAPEVPAPPVRRLAECLPFASSVRITGRRACGSIRR